jgi:hypothetical protein
MWALVGSGVMLVYGLGRWEGAMASREQEAERAARAVLAGSGRYHVQMDALRAAEAKAEGEARRFVRAASEALTRADSLQREADRLARVADSLRAAQTANGEPDPCGPATDALRACRAVGVTLREAVVAGQRALVELDLARGRASERADSAEAWVGLLDASLRAVLKARTCHLLLGVRCPSRTVAFVGGMVTVGALVVALR